MSCHNAKRCLQRMLLKDTELKTKVETMKAADPQKYSGVIRSLATRQPHTRTSAQRVKAMVFAQELARETVVRRKTSVLMLNERQFKACMVQAERGLHRRGGAAEMD